MSNLYIDQPAQLRNLCDQLRGAAWLAVDTEFIREKTYRAQLCLIQLGTHDIVACIDTLALDDLDPLFELLDDPGTLKVFHAGSQDLEIFHDITGRLPQPLFDTQIAATLAGFGDQVGYAELVRRMLDVQLDKTQTRTDWSARPLDPAQLSYAGDDVLYLGRVYERLRDQLEGQGRLAWLDDDFAALADPARYRIDPDETWRRVKGNAQLRGRQRALLRALAAWRERRAMAADKPRRWILGDDALLAMARGAPTGREALGRIRGLSEGLIRRHGADLLELIQTALEQPVEAAPEPSRPAPLGREQEALVDALMGLLRLQGARHGIAPAALGTRRELEALVRGDREVEMLKGWRRGLVGEPLQSFLSGRSRLTCRDGRLAEERD